VVAIIDSNASLDGITYPIPGNDDSTRAIDLYCRLISDAALSGIQQSFSASGADMGAAADAGEQLPAKAAAEAAEHAAREKDEQEAEEKRGRGGKGRGGPAKKAPVVQVKKAAPGKKKDEE